MAAELTILFACAGRRIELIQAFRAASKRLEIDLKVIALDGSPQAPALYVADEAHLAPPIRSDEYIPYLVDLARKTDASALLPTIDTDLRKLAEARDQFDAVNCAALIGAPDIIDICSDKSLTFRFLRDSGIETPRTWTPEELDLNALPAMPLFLKPRAGSASKAVQKITTAEELAFFLPRTEAPIVQEFIAGTEYTLDVYVGLTGKARCVVPRRRLQVRGGEVHKGVTVKDAAIMQAGRKLADALGDSPRGLITLQCIVDEQQHIRFIEINPRFGGGAPLGIAAGADYPRWLMQELLGQTPDVSDDWQDGLAMYRYDWSVFAPLADEIGQAHRDAPPFA